MPIETIPACSSKVTVSEDLISPNSPVLASTNAVPTFGCPANGTSLAGVKMRTLRVCPTSDGKTNELSEKLNSRAICCICCSERPSAWGRTASGFPPNRVSVKRSNVNSLSFIGDPSLLRHASRLWKCKLGRHRLGNPSVHCTAKATDTFADTVWRSVGEVQPQRIGPTAGWVEWRA